MKRAAAFLPLLLLLSLVGIAFHQTITNPPTAEASGGGAGSGNIGSATGTNLTLTATSGTPLTVTGANGGNGVVVSIPTTGYAISSTSLAGGYSLALFNDTTAQVNPPLYIEPTDSDPSGANVLGDFNVRTTSGTLRTCAIAGTPGSWHDVGSWLLTRATNTAFATGGQASATIVCDNESVSILSTVATLGDSAKLPLVSSGATAPPTGKYCEVWNRGAASANLFVGSGGTMVNAGSATLNGSIAIPANRGASCRHLGSDVWGCSVLP